MGDEENTPVSLEDIKESLDKVTETQKQAKVCKHAAISCHDYVARFYCTDPKLKELLKKYNTTEIDCRNHDDTNGYRGGCECFEDCGKSLAEKLKED